MVISLCILSSGHTTGSLWKVTCWHTIEQYLHPQQRNCFTTSYQQNVNQAYCCHFMIALWLFKFCELSTLGILVTMKWKNHITFQMYSMEMLRAQMRLSILQSDGCLCCLHAYLNHLSLKKPIKIKADDTFILLLLSFKENKAWCSMWILCLVAEDLHDISSLIFSEKQWKCIYECRLLQSWLVH